jgi:N-hydroxyarylamine O-acetyltransferase
MNTRAYLERIGLSSEPLPATTETLKRLQRRHLVTVPFENLDIIWGRPITLDIERLFAKVVEANRGGFCYELNGLFNELLNDLGFETRLVSARVFNGEIHGPEFDHAAVMVRIDGDEYLADVGYGDFSAEPLRYILDEEQSDANGIFVIRKFDNDYLEVAKRVDDSWKSEYIFKDISRKLVDFTEMCDFQQYSPNSHFNTRKLCTIMTESGRKTLSDEKLVVTSHGQKSETSIVSELDFNATLLSEFGITASALQSTNV